MRIGVQLRVRVVDLRDLGEMLVFQPVSLVVFVAELAEELRERCRDALGLVLVPGGGSEIPLATVLWTCGNTY